MNRRLTFLLGNLCGVVVGGLLVSVYFSNQPISGTIAPPFTSPRQAAIPVKFNSVETPNGWHRRDFNGRPFYIIPLAAPELSERA